MPLHYYDTAIEQEDGIGSLCTARSDSSEMCDVHRVERAWEQHCNSISTASSLVFIVAAWNVLDQLARCAVRRQCPRHPNPRR